MYQRHIGLIVAGVAILWCGGIALRWHYQKIEPILAYSSSWPSRPPVLVGNCNEHDFVVMEQRQTSAGDRYQLRFCLTPIVEGAAFHIDDNGKITPLPIEHKYTFPVADSNGVLLPQLPPEDERVQRYAAARLRRVHPNAADEARVQAMAARAGQVLLVAYAKLLFGGLAGLAFAVWLVGRLSRR